MLYATASNLDGKASIKRKFLGGKKLPFFLFANSCILKANPKNNHQERSKKNMTKMSEYKVVFVVYATVHGMY